MNIRVLKIDNSGIEARLDHLCDLLERILEATNPITPAMLSDFPEELNKVRAFYNDERQEIIDERLRRMGKVPKE